MINIDIIKEKYNLDEDSAFEKLLKVLVDKGVDKEEAMELIGAVIEEQYKLDELQDELSESVDKEKGTIDVDKEMAS